MHVQPNVPLLTSRSNSPEQLRVLVVDDEPSVRLIARLMLERAGYAVEEAEDAAVAVARAQSGRGFAMVLLDVSLPDRAGTDLIPELRSLVPDARVVLTSGRAEEDVPGHGADGFLPKPFSRDQLLAAVRTVLGAV